MAIFSRRTLLLLLLRKKLQRKNIVSGHGWEKSIKKEKLKVNFTYSLKRWRFATMNCFSNISEWTQRNTRTLIAPAITKSSIKREVIGPSERLSVTLRYLSTGDSHVTIGSSFRISPTSIGRIINETSQAIWDILMPIYLQVPHTVEEWKKIANEFENKWQFNHCVGAIYGKNVVMQAPPFWIDVF